ncbi:MAG: hypothetical protein AB7V62_08515 [Thermoleophilia bacterium]
MAKGAKGAKGGKGAGGESAETPMAMWIGRARAIGALVGFAIAFWVCRRQGFPVADAALRGLVGAVAMSLVAWWSALIVIQALMRSAVAQAQREAIEAAEAQAAAAQAAEDAFARRAATQADDA